MLFGNRRPRKLTARGLVPETFRPRSEPLEARLLMAIDLGGTLPSISPTIATAPFGIGVGGNQISQGAGFSVADVGNVVSGTSFDDFVIGAPTVSTSPGTIGTGINAAAYLVFGSQTITGTGMSTVTDWIGKNGSNAFNYTPNDRIADLGQVTSPANATPTTQINPITGTAVDFPFAAIKFVNTINLQSMLGVSVAGLRLPSGQGAILFGAPGALDGNQLNPGTGRAYLVWGAFNNFVGDTVNLDDPNFATDFPGLNLITFVSTTNAGARLGASVAGGSNIFGDGASDIILGAPGATVAPNTPTPVPTNTGVVYAMSTSGLPTGVNTINVSTFGQSGTTSAIFSGVASGDQAGFSVADGGDVNGTTSGGVNVDDLLIGAPTAASSAGAAYLIYGGSGLASLATTTNGVRYINLSNVGTTVPGATITGPAGGSATGFAVSSAGDFNNDGFSDILVGTPDFSSSSTVLNQGAVTMLYGAASTSSAALTGTISLSNIPTAIQSASFTGANAGDLAGYALSFVGIINVGQPNLILIGAPGFNAGSGTAYLIPGRSGLTGTFSLATEESAPLSGLQFVLTTPSSPSTSPNFFGASVSSRFQDTTVTADSDSFADFIIGAPGYDVTQDSTRILAGGAMIVEGGLITVPTPTPAVITTNIGVGSATGPFSINATTPAALQIFVFGSTSTTPNFMPVTDIDPTTVVVNGVAFPNATIQQDPNTGNYNPAGIPDAIITISPRSALNLPTGTVTFTVTGKTLATSDLPNMTWTGTASVAVTGGSVTPVVPIAGVPTGPVLETTFVPTFGANQYTPSLAALSMLNYTPIPLSVALQQYLPPQGFRQRIYSFNHPGKTVGPFLTNRGQNKGAADGRNTLSSRVFDRSRFHPPKTYGWTPKAPKLGTVRSIIPVQAGRRQTFVDNGISSVHRGNGTRNIPGS